MKGAPLPPMAPGNTALVLHDMQNDFIKASLSTPEMTEVVKRTRSLIDLSHSRSIPVIYTRVENDPAMGYPPGRAPYLRKPGAVRCIKDTPGAEIIDQLKPTPQDFIVTKVRSSGFYGTKMESVLRNKGVWILVVAGGSTNHGVEWLARDAKARDMVTVALKDCTYSATPEVQAASLANIDDFIGYVMGSDEVVQILSKAA